MLMKQNKLMNLGKSATGVGSLMRGNLTGVHGMIKQIIMINSAIFGGYLLMNGPSGLAYRKYLTLSGTSTFTSLPACHFAHTDVVNFGVNTIAMFTLGNLHARKYGCGHFVGLMGASMAAATAYGLYHVYGNNERVIEGSGAMTAGLITYHAFKNQNWFTFLKIHPYIWLAALTMYGAYGSDNKIAVRGGMMGGFLAVYFL